MKKQVIATLVLSIFSLFLLSCSSSDQSSSEGKASSGSSAGKSGASGVVAADLDGNRVSLDDYLGRGPVILNFWGTWCPPCRYEIPDLVRIYEEYKPQGLEIVGLAINDRPGKVRAYAAEKGIEWIMLMASREAAMAFQLGRGIPVTIFIDRDGNEIGRKVGMGTYDEFKSYVERMI